VLNSAILTKEFFIAFNMLTKDSLFCNGSAKQLLIISYIRIAIEPITGCLNKKTDRKVTF
jgi:hypothetical protein